jgi:hypothetical protein
LFARQTEYRLIARVGAKAGHFVNPDTKVLSLSANMWW